MKKAFVLAAGVLTQLVLGSIYSWSEIASRLSTDWGLLVWQTQLMYGMSIAVFSFGTIITGPLVRKIGPGRMTLYSAIGFALAFTGAFLSNGSFYILLPSIGLGVGIAMAMGYVVPLATATAWFPDKKGTVTGLAVMGFGGGAILTSQLIHVLSNQNWDILNILLLLGIIGGSILTLSSLFQKFPVQSEAPIPSNFKDLKSRRVVLKDSTFWALWSVMFLSTIGGLIVIGNAESVAIEWNLMGAVSSVVSVLAVGNALGRLIWGGLLDKLGHKAIPLSLILMTLGFIMILFAGTNPIIFLIGIFLSGTQFGSALVIYAAFTEEIFGHGAISKIYPFIFAAYGIAALVGPTIGGAIFDIGGSYRPVIIMSIAFPLLALIISFIRKNFEVSEEASS
jgi:OFA family oxalate/formate antiporter-like MFS transporter